MKSGFLQVKFSSLTCPLSAMASSTIKFAYFVSVNVYVRIYTYAYVHINMYVYIGSAVKYQLISISYATKSENIITCVIT